MMKHRPGEKLIFFCLLLAFPHLGNTIWGEIKGWGVRIGKGLPDTVTWLTQCVSLRKKVSSKNSFSGISIHLVGLSFWAPQGLASNSLNIFPKFLSYLENECHCLGWEAPAGLSFYPWTAWRTEGPKPLRAMNCFPRSLLWCWQGLWLAGLSVLVEQLCSHLHL